MTARPRIGELLVTLGQLTREQLETALEQQRTQGAAGRRLGQLLVDLGFISEVQLTKVLSQHLSVPWVSLHHIDFSRQLLNLVPKELAEEFCVIPIYVRHERKSGDTLYLAMEDPTHDEAVRRVMTACGMPVKSMIAAPSDIRGAIRAFYGGGASELPPPAVTTPVITVPKATPPPTPRKPPPPPVPASRPTPAAAAPVVVPPPATPVVDVKAPVVAETSSTDSGEFDVHAGGDTPDTIPPPGHAAPAATVDHDEGPIEPVVIPRPPHRPSLPGMPMTPVATPSARLRRPGAEKPVAKTGGPRMLALTLLDGTTIQIPAQRKRATGDGEADRGETSAEHEAQLTTRDLIAALRAVASGANPDEALGDARWETLVAALLAILLRKQLISDWEFVEEWQRNSGGSGI